MSMSLMSSSLLLQQCPAFLVRLTWIVFMMGGKSIASLTFFGIYCFGIRLFLVKNHIFDIAQSTGAVEYTDCTSAEG